jgi:hypothetical protein
LFFSFLLLFLFSYGVTFADNFHLNQDYIDSQVFVTPLLSIDELGEGNNLYDIEYNVDDLVGVSTENLSENIEWNDYVQIINGRYRRIAGLHDKLVVPVGSKVGLFALVKNESGHDVTLKNWRIFTSKLDTNLDGYGQFGINGSFVSLPYRFMASNVFKEGRQIFNPLALNVSSNETNLVRLSSFDIQQPLVVEKFEWTPEVLNNGDLVVDFLVKLKNVSPYAMVRVDYSHKDFVMSKTFFSGTEYTYEYQLNYGSDYVAGLNFLESFEINIPGIRKGCTVLGTLGDGFGSNTKALAFERSDTGCGVNCFGQTVDLDWYPQTDAMCISTMPPKLVGKPLEHNILTEVSTSFSGFPNYLAIEDDLDFGIKIKNEGGELGNFNVFLNFDNQYQLLKNTNCDFSLNENGLFVHLSSLGVNEEVVCNFSFEILEKENYLVLRNSVVLGEEEKVVAFSKYVPDFEFSFNYDYLNEIFSFDSNVKNLFPTFEEYSKDELLCKRLVYFGLEDEICI